MVSVKGSTTECSSMRKMESATDEDPNTTKTVLDSHLDLLLNGRFADVTFLVGDRKEKILAHQLFLKARSPVFQVMLSERWNEHTRQVVLELEHIHPQTFRKFLKFIYTDTLDAAVPEALELLQLAHKYDVQLLVTKCEELLESQLTLEDALPVFQTARMYKERRLMDNVGELWAASLPQMLILQSFNQLDRETLLYILKREDLDMKEVDLFRLALQWGGNQTDTLQESLQDILPLIRFPTMTLHEFTDTVVPTELLSPSTVLQLFTYFGTEDMAKRRSLAKTLGFNTQQRQRKRNVVYVALYPDDNGSKRHEHFENLKESLQFHEFYDFEMQPEDLILGVGLSGFTFHCPAKATILAASGTASGSTSFKTFNIGLKIKDYDDYPHNSFYYCREFYRELLTLTSEVEEGKTTEIKFETVFPLKKRRLYCITVEEVVDKTRIDPDPEGYNAQVFGPEPKELVTVMKNNLVRTQLDLRRNRLRGFWDTGKNSARPQLISRLAFQVL